MEKDTNDLNFRVVIKLRDFSFPRHFRSGRENGVVLHQHDEARRRLERIVPGDKTRRLFTTLSDEAVRHLVNKAKRLELRYRPANFLGYYVVDCDGQREAIRILKKLSKLDVVELGYVESHLGRPPSVNSMANPLSRYQEYLNPAPLGIDARYAWNFSGGDGCGNVKFIDVEEGWVLDHEDLAARELQVTGLNHWTNEDHGAAVLGVILMKDNRKGGVGITPKANGYIVSQWRKDGSFNTADAIMAALDNLRYGDILLLESQVFDVLDTKQMWPLEILDANFQALRLASALGIIVVEPAGNGMYLFGNDLDHFVDHQGQQIFNRSKTCFKDSGAIVVAAASSSVPHERINYSNYGSRIDCYAWGQNVTTAGLFPRSSRSCTDTYTHDFGGTSSASAIIAGAAIAVQSISEARYGVRISPSQMRHILSNPWYGTKSENGSLVDKIGVMPDLRKIIDRALKSGPRKTNKSLA